MEDICSGYLSLRSLDFHRMLFRLDECAIGIRVNLGELCPEESDLRGVVDPQQESDQRTSRPVR